MVQFAKHQSLQVWDNEAVVSPVIAAPAVASGIEIIGLVFARRALRVRFLPSVRWHRTRAEKRTPPPSLEDQPMTRHKRPALPPVETSEQLRARLRAFALATREEAMKPRKVSFPEHVMVLAGPLRCLHARRSGSGDKQTGEPDGL
jgi:hypothetical protein